MGDVSDHQMRALRMLTARHGGPMVLRGMGGPVRGRVLALGGWVLALLGHAGPGAWGGAPPQEPAAARRREADDRLDEARRLDEETMRRFGEARYPEATEVARRAVALRKQLQGDH